VIELRCDTCRLVWHEDREPGDTNVGPHGLVCPRCHVFGGGGASSTRTREEQAHAASGPEIEPRAGG